VLAIEMICRREQRIFGKRRKRLVRLGRDRKAISRSREEKISSKEGGTNREWKW